MGFGTRIGQIAIRGAAAIGKGAMSRAYLCVSIDTGSDKARGSRARRPRSFEGITDGVVKRIHPLFERFGAKPTYLLSPEVLRDAACVDAFRKLAASAELGTHLVGEYADPGASDPEITQEFQRDYPPEIERQKVTYLTDLFIRAFDHQPQAFRAARSGVGPASFGILESLGYAVESSVTPHIDGFHDAPSQPYRPDRAAPGRPGDSTILEVPVTIRRRFLHAVPGLARRLDHRWLSPTRGTSASLVRLAEDEIAAARRRAPERAVILNAVFRNIDVVPHASPDGANEEQARGVLDRLRALLAYAHREAIAVIGLGDVPELLSDANHAG